MNLEKIRLKCFNSVPCKSSQPRRLFSQLQPAPSSSPAKYPHLHIRERLAGVTRLPAEVVGAIDIHQRHTLVDVAEEHAAQIIKKLTGIPLKGQALAPALVGNETKG